MESSKKGQSAIEYLMTYGWMLLVVAIIGGAIFSVVQSQNVESTSGFTGSDIQIEDFGLTSNDTFDLNLRNANSEPLEIKNITVSDGQDTLKWNGSANIPVTDTNIVSLENISEADSTNNLDVTITYDRGNLPDIQSSGEITGNYEISTNSQTTGDNTAETNNPPSASFTANTTALNTGDVFQVDASGSSDSDGSISSYRWDWTDDGTYEDTGEIQEHKYNSEGTYTVTLNVTDDSGSSSTATETVSVGSAPTISSLSPTDGSTTATSSNFNFTFNEQIQRGSGDFILYNSTGNEIERISVSENSKTTINTVSTTNDTLSIEPSTTLNGSTEYYWNAETGSIQDTVEKEWNGIDDTNTYNFTTESTTTFVDNFEDKDLKEYSTSGSTQVNSVAAYESDYGLNLTDNGGISSSKGLENYPSAGDSFEFYAYLTAESTVTRMNYGMQDSNNNYKVQLQDSNGGFIYNNFLVSKSDGGSFSIIGQTGNGNQDIPVGEWLRVRVDWSSDGTHRARLFDSTGNKLADVSGSDSSFSSGSIQFSRSMKNSPAGESSYIDQVKIIE